MKAQHTAGPWDYRARRDATRDEIGVRQRAGDNFTARVIATVQVRRPVEGGERSDACTGWPEGEADARLIAAAPDLLASTQAAWNCIAALPPTQARVEVAQMLQASIDKATGGAQ